MKKFGILALATVLALAAAPALAWSVGVDVDGKTYTFCEDGEGGDARYEIDGKTFYVSRDEVIVQEAGKPDKHLPLSEASEEDATEGTAERVGEVTVFGAEDATAEGGDSAAAWDAEYAAFAPYGLSCDAAAGKLYYMGAPVRVFEDARGVDGGIAELNYFDADGTVDVRTLRDAQGELTGLQPLSEAEFAGRDLTQWTNPEPTQIELTATATDGAELTPAERAAFFAPYAPYGLRYDAAQDALYFNDRPVCNFLDVRSSNGEPPTNGKFQGTLTQLRFEGEVDVTILRDYADPDASGEGKIIGVEATEATKE